MIIKILEFAFLIILNISLILLALFLAIEIYHRW